MNLIETYFYDLVLLSRVSPVGTTHKGVTSCALTRPMGPARVQLLTWRHVNLNHAKPYGTTQSHRLLWRD
jgi:hypothetical protein